MLQLQKCICRHMTCCRMKSHGKLMWCWSLGLLVDASSMNPSHLLVFTSTNAFNIKQSQVFAVGKMLVATTCMSLWSTKQCSATSLYHVQTDSVILGVGCHVVGGHKVQYLCKHPLLPVVMPSSSSSSLCDSVTIYMLITHAITLTVVGSTLQPPPYIGCFIDYTPEPMPTDSLK
jgi:hypothetical protein